ncbi:hypothetical protein [Thermocatellispora tengchongensis]|uniref:hypothetical protein n=1 Tax=Thermocatellispora tengchongensis TaxID=1073253 RepID=UPI003639A4AC
MAAQARPRGLRHLRLSHRDGQPHGQAGQPAQDPSPDPNTAIRSSLSRAQARAYEEAEQTCLREAVKRVYGKDVTSMRDHFEQAAAYARRLLSHELDRDPALVERAAAMASCLRAKGYAVGSAAPTALASRGREAFEAIKEPMGEPIPEEQRVAFDAPKGARYEPNLTIEQARPYLAREVRDALDDLECGKDFYRLYEPRRTEIEHRAYREFGLE